MTQPAADRNLLFGILAVQMDFISRDALISAMSAWVLDKKTSLGDILLKQKALPADSHALLEALVKKHLALHGNDAEKSLAAISSAGPVRQELEKITDVDVQASLVHVAAPRPEAARGPDPYATASVGASTSDGLRFRVLRPHAKGGLGAVFVAHDGELNREVALKEIQDRHADDLESRSRFLLEAEITGGLEHPGIVPVYGLGTYADGRPYYAMRFIRGDNLKDAVDRFHKKEGTFSAGERTLELRGLLGRFIDVCNAIAYAHSRGVLHRDLKPGNIMLGKYGETLVVDWGLAKPVGAETGSRTDINLSEEGSLTPRTQSNSSQTLMGSAVGTPQYMSPEQAAGRLDQIGPPSDVYSLGAALYYLLTGKPTIDERDVGMVLQKVQKGEFRRPRQVNPQVPPALEAICLKAMALQPADRYDTPRTLATDIEHWLADEPVSAWPEPWTIKARRWMGRHRVLVTSLASAVVVAVLGLSMATVLLTAANDRERAARADAETQRTEAVAQRAEAVKQKEKAVAAKEYAETQEAEAKNQKEKAVAAKVYAETQEAEARKQKEKAEQNFKLARNAVDRYHTAVSEDVLLNEPGMEQLRKKLLEAAREFYDGFVKEHADDVSVRADFGKALYRLAQITGDIGSANDAVTLHGKAVKVFQSLTDRQAGPEIKANLAACFHHLGRLYRKLEDRDRSAENYQNALAIWEELAGRNASEAHQAGLAETQNGLGNLNQNLRKTAVAQMYYEKALAGWKTLAGAHANEPKYRRSWAVADNNLGMLIMWLPDKRQDGVKLLLEAEAIQSKLVNDHRTIAQYKDDLAVTRYNLGHGYAGWKADESVAQFLDAAKLWEGLIERHPAVTSYQNRLADCYDALAEWYRIAEINRNGSNFEQAEKVSKDALSIRIKLAETHKDNADLQAGLARGHYMLGEFYRASGNSANAARSYSAGLPILEELTTAKPGVPRFRADLARTHGRLGLLFLRDMNDTQASAELTSALMLWWQLVKEYPAEQKYADELETISRNLITVSRNLVKSGRAGKNQTDAVATLTRTLDTVDVKDNKLKAAGKDKERAALPPSLKTTMAALYSHRAELLTEVSRPAEALADWDRALELSSPSGGAYYRVAQAYAVAAASVARDDNQPQRQMLAEQHALRALKLLEAARVAGFFKMPDNLLRLRTDTDFDALRDRPDFKQLLGDGSP